MLTKLIRYNYYQRLRTHMEINKRVGKENIEIKATFDRSRTTLLNKLQTKFKGNKKRITMFLAMVVVCNLHFAYQYLLGTLPYRNRLLTKFKALCLGNQSVYTNGVIEQIFDNKLSIEFVQAFNNADDILPLGFTRKLLIRCLKECQIQTSKEQRAQFYLASGFIDKSYQKSSGLNLKELNYIIRNIDINMSIFTQALQNQLHQESIWQSRTIQQQKSAQNMSKQHDYYSVTKRIQPSYDII